MRVHVSPTQVQHPQPRSPAPQCFSESQHILRRSPQPIQRRDDQSVAVLERLHRLVKLWAGCTGARHSMVDIEIIVPYTCTDQIRHLTVRVLLSCRDPRIPNQFFHVNPYMSRNQCLVPDSRHRDKAHSCETHAAAETCGRKKVGRDVSQPLTCETYQRTESP